MTKQTMNKIQGSAILIGMAVSASLVIFSGSWFGIFLGGMLLAGIVEDARFFRKFLQKDRELDESVNKLLQEGRDRRRIQLHRQNA